MRGPLVGLLMAASWPLGGCAQPEAQVVVAVVDEDGSAVTNVQVGVATSVWRTTGLDPESIQVEALTDTNGMATLTISSKRGDLYIGMQQTAGFYYDDGIVLYMTNSAGGRWQPWGQTNVLVVRRIVNPIPMYAQRLVGGDWIVPANGVPVGFDLMESDWTPPYGKGVVADLLFRVEWKNNGRNASQHLRFEATMNLAFSNEGDGIQEIHIPYHAPPRGSVYRMPRLAPDENYVPRMSWTKIRTDTECSPEPAEDLNYFFRVRTRKNEDGKIVSALYGKIHGPIQFGLNDQGACIMMTYYLNPAPNDRNTEFDPKRNLLNVEGSRRVIDP